MPPLVLVTLAVFVHGVVVHVVPAGGVAVTLLVIDPVALNCTVPFTTIVRLVPFGRLTFGSAIVLPVPLAPVPAAVVSQSAPVPFAVHVHPLTVTVAGTVSDTLTPVTSLGSVFVTVIV